MARENELMSPSALSIYHRLPSRLQMLAASARGVWLNSWRYGAETEQLVDEASERETWSAERWRSWQEGVCAKILHRAAARVPYYREMWAERRRRGDRSSPERLENWPVLSKETVRSEGRRLVADDVSFRRLFHEHTSGTTGTPISVWLPRAAVRRWYALMEARIRRWNGVTRSDRWGMLGGQLIAPVERVSPPYWVWNPPMHQLYLSSYHLASGRIPHYVKALKEYEVVWILGYASSLATLAQTILENGTTRMPLQVAVSNAEPLYPHQRERIAKAFGCAVRDTYGMAEQVAAASECAKGALHLWPDVGILEILTEDREGGPLPAGVGRVVATGLLNPDMPLIRYEVGDRARLEPSVSICACGRTLPRLAEVEGRQDDVVVTPDGARVGRLDPVFKADLPIREAQIVQERLDVVRVRIVAAPGWCARDGQEIVERIQDRLGRRMTVLVETVPFLERTGSGKLRSVVSQLPREVRQGVSGP